MIKTFIMAVKRKTEKFQEEAETVHFIIKGEQEMARTLLFLEQRGIELLGLEFLGECGDNKDLAEYILDSQDNLET